MSVSDTSTNVAPDRQQQAINDELETLRAINRVRELNSTEEGFALDQLPGGVYGFTYAPQQEIPLFQRKNYRNFEVHKLADNSIQLVGFVTQEEAGRLNSASENIEVGLYPDAVENSAKAVSIPISRVLNTKGPLREEGYVLKLEISPSTDLPS